MNQLQVFKSADFGSVRTTTINEQPYFVGKKDASKVLFAKAVEASHTTILIGDLAKLIRQNGVNIGQRRLFSWMRDNGFLMKVSDSYNMPTQYAMERGLFEVKESTISNPDGSNRVTKTTKVTGKGQTYFINKFFGVA